MVWVGEREIIMPRGWVVLYKDGTAICEDDMHWKKLPNKKEIKKVLMKYEDRLWSIDNQEHYTVPTTKGYHDISISAGGASISPQGIHSRTIGYYDMENKCKVILRCEEANGKVTWEVKDF
ncbi:hypothetical protein LCGC14_1103280 [marine sediment metagenome]|uniref:Uncharacterized protein n=1 Tax=marine sediment metagenome TaxID=412755 RepID=A0A0F9MWT2_9ZZZZ